MGKFFYLFLILGLCYFACLGLQESCNFGGCFGLSGVYLDLYLVNIGVLEFFGFLFLKVLNGGFA